MRNPHGRTVLGEKRRRWHKASWTRCQAMVGGTHHRRALAIPTDLTRRVRSAGGTSLRPMYLDLRTNCLMALKSMKLLMTKVAKATNFPFRRIRPEDLAQVLRQADGRLPSSRGLPRGEQMGQDSLPSTSFTAVTIISNINRSSSTRGITSWINHPKLKGWCWSQRRLRERVRER